MMITRLKIDPVVFLLALSRALGQVMNSFLGTQGVRVMKTPPTSKAFGSHCSRPP